MDKQTALVLAGGGSFGAVQAGMLRALVAHGIVPDLVVGSSVGAINGAYFAGAPDAQGVAKLESIWRSLRRREVFPFTWRSLLGLFARRNFVVDPNQIGTTTPLGLSSPFNPSWKFASSSVGGAPITGDRSTAHSPRHANTSA